ncbi:flagellar biosynthesis protein FlhF [Reinekea forsetii]|nr:flagellar biosynthesis protein FlhF [Reinekea forsetii]
MKIKRFTASNMQAGLKMISEALGPEAVILSNKRMGSGLEIVAGVDEQDYEQYAAEHESEVQSDVKHTTESGIIKAQASQSLDADTMAQLLDGMAGKNKQLFTSARDEPPVNMAPSAQENINRVMERPTHQRAQYTQSFAASPSPKVQGDSAPISKKDSEAFDVIRQEIDSLKSLLKEQTEQLSVPVGQVNPQYERLESRLQTLGFTRSVVNKLMAHYDREDSLESNWRRLMGRLSSAIPAPLYEPTANGGVFAVNGPTGAGKTTTIAKLAAHAVKDFGQENVALISLDWFQVGGQDILKSVSSILNVEFHALTEGDSLGDKLTELKAKKIVFIDTSGSKEAMAYWNALISKERLSRVIQTMMVIPATMQPAALSQFIQNYTNVNFDSVILTKLDESASFGGVLEPVLKHRWPIWYCSDGQNIPQDIEMCEVKPLVQRLVSSLNGRHSSSSAAEMALKVG